jgi:hypothetical protein
LQQRRKTGSVELLASPSAKSHSRPGFQNGFERRFPQMDVVVISSSLPPELPGDARFMPKPWRPLDVLREVQRVMSTH